MFIVNSDRDYTSTVADFEDGCIACGEFFCKENIQEATVTECNDTNLFLVVGVDASKIIDDCPDKETYANIVAEMVKRLLLK